MFIYYDAVRTCDYNMHAEGLLPANLCLVTLLSSEQRLQSERFHLQHVQMVNQTSCLKRKIDWQ